MTLTLKNKVFEEIYGIPTVSLRYFNVFGHRQDPNSQYAAVIPKFITSILNGYPPTVYVMEHKAETFHSLKMLLMQIFWQLNQIKQEFLILHAVDTIILNDLIDIINELLGKDIKPEYLDPRPGDIKHSLADIDAAKSFEYNPIQKECLSTN